MKMFNNSKDAEEDANDYMCIQYKLRTDSNRVSRTGAICPSFIRNVWVGHAVARYVSVDDTQMVELKFVIQHHNSPPPPELLSADKYGVKCTVEFLTKSLPDRCSVFLAVHSMIR